MTSEADGDSAAEIIVRTMLHAAGLHPSDREIAALADGYTTYRTQVDRLYSVPLPMGERPATNPGGLPGPSSVHARE